MKVVPVVATIAAGVAKAAPERQVEDEAAGPGPRREEQPQGGLHLKKEESKKLDEAQRACAVERHEEAISSNEELVRQKDETDGKVGDLQRELEGERAKAVEEKGRLQRELEAERVQATAEKESLKEELEVEKAKAASERAALQKELGEERVKAVSQRAAYLDLCVATVEQFKGFAKFQVAVDAAVASSLAGQESGGAGPSRTTAGRRTDAELCLSFVI
ncbi:inner centromere protein-like [Camellia sinensis]|uniref:inner centromere protein-like n=1 Tax=Camellia sinensis TaxID=4442 RepID=UPI0010356D97|nr:inner centromere protein-like [Camellia sinensis]